jgi:hypothetical protein
MAILTEGPERLSFLGLIKRRAINNSAPKDFIFSYAKVLHLNLCILLKNGLDLDNYRSYFIGFRFYR